jgi:phosphatidylglycerophosphate synthase
MNDSDASLNRRPLTSRSTGWAKFLSTSLVRGGASANAISVISIVFAIIGAVCLMRWNQTAWGLVLAALCVQLRLLCNLLDGMVAIEGGRKSAVGGLYNEVPDRIADSLFIVALGYAVNMIELGWFAALAAAVTAYIRVLGGTLGLAQDFRGPMAKPHRMAVLTVGCIVGAIELWLNGSQWALVVALWIIALGSVLTCWTRLAAIAKQLHARNS